MFVVPLPSGSAAQAIACSLRALPGFAWLRGDGSDEGRYSFLAAAPVAIERARLSDPEPLALLDRLEGASDGAGEHGSPTSPVPRALGQPSPAGASYGEHGLTPSRVPRFIGYIAYDACLARRTGRFARDPDAPALCFARYDALVAYDEQRRRAWIVGDDEEACERLRSRTMAPARTPAARASRVSPSDPADHREAIDRALAHIARGDVYQVNLARSFRAGLSGDALALELAMQRHSPVPFGMFFDDGERVVLARTMERFLRWERAERTLVTRPIKGTLARGGDEPREARELASDPKERAEHAMIIDLMRNDLGRVAEVGSVQVPQIMAVEHYRKLCHLVSTVRCVTRAEVSLRAILEATFPPGSVTGTPKRRAMELIEALEAEPRGIYTGAVGHVDRSGGLSLAVAIRTAVVERGTVRYFAGGGIVEASRPERELEETELKARVFLDAMAELDEGPSEDEPALSDTPLVR